MKIRDGFQTFILFGFAIVTSFLYAQKQPVPSAPAYVVERDVVVPMRDGIKLRADILRPRGNAKVPVLVYRTPYGKEPAQKDYTTFVHAVERGYTVVIQDVRGRYASAGVFRPYQSEGADGYDTIEWAARQRWSNGKVGTFGLSYPGAVQWLAAVENPPHLKAMVPAMTFSTARNFFYAGGTWDMSWIQWIWDNIAPDVRSKRNLPGPKTPAEARAAWEKTGERMLNELPLSGLAEMRGIAPYYYEWLSHPPNDPWWDWSELRNKYSRVHAAVLNLSGWYDDNYGPEGATTNFAGLLKARAGQNSADTHLLIGPWVHGVDNTEKNKSGEREFARSAAINYDAVVLRWLDHYLRDVDNGVDREPPVRYFVMGADEWREGTAWPPMNQPSPFFLQNPDTSQNRGLLQSEKPQNPESYTDFISDPESPVINPYASSGAHDYQQLVTLADVLTFDSAPLVEDTEVTGNIHGRVFVSCDCQDLDVWFRLLDVAPNGTAFNLMNPGLDVERASYRDPDRQQLLVHGQIYEIDLPNLITSNLFKKGHRIRIQISGSFFPNFSRNLQTGKSEATSAEMRKATIRIYHDREHPSQVLLPIVKR